MDSIKVPELDKHLKKAGGHIGRNIVEMDNEDNSPKTLNDRKLGVFFSTFRLNFMFMLKLSVRHLIQILDH